MRPLSRRSLVISAHALSTRRLLSFLACILLLSTILLLFAPTALISDDIRNVNIKANLPESITQLKDRIHIPSAATRLAYPFGPAVHKPPPPSANSTTSTAHWFGSWKWRNPFSSSIAQGDDRVALPPLEQRCKVFTYHEGEPQDTKKALAETEDKLLLAWRKAWWAFGFLPVIVGLGEAKQHPLYAELSKKDLSDELRAEVMQWLAWSQLGTGIFVDYRILPMAARNDKSFNELRSCDDWEHLTHYGTSKQKLYTAKTGSIDKVLRQLISHHNLDEFDSIEAAVGKSAGLILSSQFPTALADYTTQSIRELYKSLEVLDLPNLINAHLHSTFLSQYTDGVSYLAPFGNKFNILHRPAITLANRIAACPKNNPVPGSCPPNIRDCSPCKNRAAIASHSGYVNSTTTFLFVVVPHPYTTIALTNEDIMLAKDPKDRIIRYIRRKSMRDPYLREVTEDLLGSKVGSQPRVMKMKEAIVRKLNEEYVSMWATDIGGFKDPEWNLGFVLPSSDELEFTLPAVDKSQQVRFEHASTTVTKSNGKVFAVVEGWNLADTELWKFANAWVNRKEAVRRQWTKDEKKFQKGLDTDER